MNSECTNCKDCRSSIGCVDSIKLNNCDYCEKCEKCKNSNFLVNCKNVKQSLHCENCKNVSRLYGWKNIENYDGGKLINHISDHIKLLKEVFSDMDINELLYSKHVHLNSYIFTLKYNLNIFKQLAYYSNEFSDLYPKELVSILKSEMSKSALK
jgi:hypothetical protein